MNMLLTQITIKQYQYIRIIRIIEQEEKRIIQFSIQSDLEVVYIVNGFQIIQISIEKLKKNSYAQLHASFQ